MRSLIHSLAAGAFLLAATSAAAASPAPYQEPFAPAASQPGATRVVHDGSLYAEAFSSTPVSAAPSRPALATSSAPYTEPFASTPAASSASPVSATSGAKPEAPATACTCPGRHG